MMQYKTYKPFKKSFNSVETKNALADYFVNFLLLDKKIVFLKLIQTRCGNV
jgi:hypothetical protein